MLYIVEDKNLEMLKAQELEEADSVLIFVKDMTRPAFSGEDVLTLLRLKGDTELVSAATRDEMVFAVGGKVFAGNRCVLLQMDIPIPEQFKENVRVVQKAVKKSSSSRRSSSARKKPVSKPVSEAVLGSVVQSVPKESETPSDDAGSE